jgi:hypothetical protein
MALEKPQPRAKYGFGEMAVNEVKKIRDEGGSGTRALNSAYAYARRNGWQFCGATETGRGVTSMLIRRVK